MEQDICNQIFVDRARYLQQDFWNKISDMGKQCQPYAARQSHLQHTGRTKVFFLIQDDLRVPQRVSHFIDILVDFVSLKNIDIDTLDCCALLPVVDGYIPPAVSHTTYIQREPGKEVAPFALT